MHPHFPLAILPPGIFIVTKVLEKSICMKPAIIALFLFFLQGTDSRSLIAHEILVSDSLNGSTVGEQAGAGQFVEGGGWRSLGGRIVYDAGRTLESGSFEAVMRGWTAPAQGAEKSHPLSGWEEPDAYTHWVQPGCYWNWRIGSRYSPFKVLAASGGVRYDTWWEIATNDMVNDGQPHLYQVVWDSGDATFYLDSDSLHRFELDTFRIRYFTIGTDAMYGPTDPAPIISNIRIVDNDGVIADFAALPTGGTAPLTVQFTDSSKGRILGYAWNFGDGHTSTEPHPAHIYETADTFTVSLIVSGHSRSDTLIRPDYITVTEPPPIANFTADTTEGAVPFEVRFTDQSSGSISSWSWEFGDGRIASEAHPVHVYLEADTFDVALTVAGPGGESTKRRAEYIIAAVPSGAEGPILRVPDRFGLFQNYPNPFNPVTRIQYRIREDGPVRLVLHDVSGREVVRLVDDVQTQGNHEVRLDGSALSCGIYLYRLESGGETMTRKLTILK